MTLAPLQPTTTTPPKAHRPGRMDLSWPAGQQKSRSGATGFGKSLEQYAPSLLEKVGFNSKRSLAGIFQPVLENFLVGIMVIDFFAVWLPRIWNSLSRGAYDYKPEKDPKAQQKTGWDKKWYVLKERGKRLNWQNGIEETWREVLSGPFLFVWPTVFFSAAKKFYGKKSLEMPYGTLKEFSDTFGAQLKDVPEQGFNFAQQTKQFVNQLFADEKMRKATMVKPTKMGSVLANQLKPTYHDFFNQWSNQLIETLQSTKSPKGQAKTLDLLRQQLVEAVESYNRHYLPEKQFLSYDKVPVKLWAQAEKGAKWLFKPTNADTLFENLVQFHDFTNQVNQSRTKFPFKALPQVVDRVRKNVMTLKTGYSIGTILITTYLLMELTKLTQSFESYQANRLIPIDEEEAAKQAAEQAALKAKHSKSAGDHKKTKVSQQPMPTALISPQGQFVIPFNMPTHHNLPAQVTDWRFGHYPAALTGFSSAYGGRR